MEVFGAGNDDLVDELVAPGAVGGTTRRCRRRSPGRRR